MEYLYFLIASRIFSIGHFLLIGTSLSLVLLLEALRDIASLNLCFSFINWLIFGKIPEVEIVIFLLLKLNPSELFNISHDYIDCTAKKSISKDMSITPDNADNETKNIKYT